MTTIFSRFALLSCLLFSMLPSAASAQSFNPAPAAGFGEQTRQFLPVDQAFAFNFIQDARSLELSWQIAPGYYLYQDRISISSEDIEPGTVTMRDGQDYHDEFFGDVKIYTEPVTVTVDLPVLTQDAEVTVRYQGCAKAGFCYPPEVRKVPLSVLTGTDSPTPPAAKNSSEKQVTEHAGLAASLADNWWTPLMFLALGIGLAFTPCVLPMYPILTSIVLGSGQLSQRRALGLSFIYVQGMALTYTLLGLVVASAGLQFQAAMQHPYVLIGLSALFIALSLSMFGLYTLQLPAGMQTWLSGLSNRQQGGSGAGVFAMGAISGLVCSPCTTAPLSGALLYVAQSGDLLTGGVALYALALGMGIPLIGAAVFGNKLLPKAGGWMDKVKILFGFVLLAAPVFLLERILPEIWTQALWSALGITAFGWLYHSKNSLAFGGWKQTTVGIIAVLGILASAQPMLDQVLRPQAVAEAAQPGQFIRVSSLEELNQQLAAAKAAGKPVMLDFYADWCVACKEFEKYTFHQPDVAAKLDQFVLLQADVTKSSPQDTELLSELSVLGLPTIDFWDADGNRLEAKRLTGFMPAEPFAEHIESL